jgi:DNA-binding response OmpR family regulator
VMQALVRRAGHEVRWAATGSTGIDEAQQWSPQIGLIDIGLPDMSGNQLAVALRQLTLSQPLLLVALTGFGEQDDRARAKDAGFDRFVVKPITMDGLHDIFGSYRSIEPTLNSSA